MRFETWPKSMVSNLRNCEVLDLGRYEEYIADDRRATPEYFEMLKNMTDDELAQHIEKLKKQGD